MENWEFLLQRKGDKSWLPLESPTVEILEGPYRLAARSALANTLVGIAIVYQPLADIRHQPIQQKIVKRVSHDGLLIVMPYTSFSAGAWQIDCVAAESDAETGIQTTNITPTWKRTVKFDVIQVSSEMGADWQYSEIEEEEFESEINEGLTNALGIVQTEPSPLVYSSPILDIAEQRSTELVQSMFEEFALFDDDDDFDDSEIETDNERLSDRPNLLGQIETYGSNISEESADIDASFQPRILFRLKQPQYIVDENNSFKLTGEVYTQGEIEVSLKNPQTLDVIFNQRFTIVRSGDLAPSNGAIPFSYQIIVPPPSEVQVLIGEVQIHPQKDFQQYNSLFVTQQAIAVSYPASRVLPELIKEAQKYNISEYSQNPAETVIQNSSETAEFFGKESITEKSYPQSPQSFPQGLEPTPSPSPKSTPLPALSLPPLPSKSPQTVIKATFQPQQPQRPLSLPPLPLIKNQDSFPPKEEFNLAISDDNPQSFPQVEMDDLQTSELELSSTDIYAKKTVRLDPSDPQPLTEATREREPELLYSFEDELPHNYQELLEQPSLQNPELNRKFNNQGSGNRGNRFLNKLQTLSAEAIAIQKANQRTDELLLDTLPKNRSLTSDNSNDLSAAIDLDNINQPVRTIAEANSLAELDLELDVELDRLLAPESTPILTPILNEYVWEESVESSNFANDISSDALSATAQTIQNLQESSTQALSEQESIPIPEIVIPTAEIVSGTPIMIIVRLPVLIPKFFVKFWIKDLQTRTIIDGPRWLLDFSAVPNANFIETRTNISIPLSSIDVAFEAIAIEAQTQRESHKTRIIRSVIPPNLGFNE